MSVMEEPTILDLFQQGRFHELIAQARSQSVTAESDPEQAQLLAAALFRIGEFPSADPILQGLEAAFGTNAGFLSLYGANCRRLGRLSQADDLFKRALGQEPESEGIRNNYSNLLIDLGRLDEAKAILSGLLEQNPDYQDARANLNRISLQQQAGQVPSNTAPSSGVDGWSMADPLLLAFSEDEVERTSGRKPGSPNTSTQAFVDALPAPDDRAAALEQLQQAENAVIEKQYAFALELCSQVHRVLGAHAPVYDCVSDAYLNLQCFREAELCLLHAVALGGRTPKRCLNLVSFASMRGDLALARHHLQQAASLDPSHPQLAAIRSSLEKRAERASSTKPYQFQKIGLDANTNQSFSRSNIT